MTNYNFKNFKILYAEDEKIINQSITNLLTKINMDVTSVFNGEERIENLKINNYDILITDMNMPKVGGIKLIEKAIEITKNNK